MKNELKRVTGSVIKMIFVHVYASVIFVNKKRKQKLSIMKK